MLKKIGLMQILSFVTIAGLLAVVLFMRSSLVATQRELAAIPIPQTGVEQAAVQEPVADIDPATANAFVVLPDGSRVEMLSGTEFIVLEEQVGESPKNNMNLAKGEIVLMLQADRENWFTVETASGFTARLKGCSMAVTNKPAEGIFEVACINGTCELIPGTGSSTTLRSGEKLAYVWGKQGEVGLVEDAVLAEKYSSTYQQCAAPVIPVTGGAAATATPTGLIPVTGGTATDDLAATATAACSVFEENFPGTPCP